MIALFPQHPICFGKYGVSQKEKQNVFLNELKNYK